MSIEILGAGGGTVLAGELFLPVTGVGGQPTFRGQGATNIVATDAGVVEVTLDAAIGEDEFVGFATARGDVTDLSDLNGPTLEWADDITILVKVKNLGGPKGAPEVTRVFLVFYRVPGPILTGVNQIPIP